VVMKSHALPPCLLALNYQPSILRKSFLKFPTLTIKMKQESGTRWNNMLKGYWRKKCSETSIYAMNVTFLHHLFLLVPKAHPHEKCKIISDVSLLKMSSCSICS
jgi:hypothetical protein